MKLNKNYFVMIVNIQNTKQADGVQQRWAMSKRGAKLPTDAGLLS